MHAYVRVRVCVLTVCVAHAPVVSGFVAVQAESASVAPLWSTHVTNLDRVPDPHTFEQTDHSPACHDPPVVAHDWVLHAIEVATLEVPQREVSTIA